MKARGILAIAVIAGLGYAAWRVSQAAGAFADAFKGGFPKPGSQFYASSEALSFVLPQSPVAFVRGSLDAKPRVYASNPTIVEWPDGATKPWPEVNDKLGTRVFSFTPGNWTISDSDGVKWKIVVATPKEG